METGARAVLDQFFLFIFSPYFGYNCKRRECRMKADYPLHYKISFFLFLIMYPFAMTGSNFEGEMSKIIPLPLRQRFNEVFKKSVNLFDMKKMLENLNGDLCVDLCKKNFLIIDTVEGSLKSKILVPKQSIIIQKCLMFLWPIWFQ